MKTNSYCFTVEKASGITYQTFASGVSQKDAFANLAILLVNSDSDFIGITFDAIATEPFGV